ncbi:GntR family transcriptional regulator [Aliiroseovarius sp. F20344]|uniref:GntR family transcriptional regulator n=1 Tax=Aliiroseovarius sp. F20344 TaxID=2926414 RepID=UPI001FF169E9|nr:GntR family transcriptional regulator [Aliiroseovarius sp. F20344]MCK0141710.1 GntR family transcriptional regulator [Aliiroseovarius sp. F20344]
MTVKRKIARQSLPDVITNDLRERILSGDLIEGTVIRQEALADEYDVSRMPIREALKRLDAEGLVHLTNNRGASVVKHSIAEIGEIFDLRILIEVDLFKRAIPNMTQADFDKCEMILAQMETSYDADDVAHWGALNFEYHTALYAAAERGLTNELLHRVNLQSDRYVRMHLSLMEQRDGAKDEHSRLLELAKAGDVDAATALLTQHIQNTKDELLTVITALRDAEAR